MTDKDALKAQLMAQAEAAIDELLAARKALRYRQLCLIFDIEPTL